MKEGGLPHISYVIRKPEPLGTEFKTAADPATSIIMLALEIQEGKPAMDAMRARMGCLKASNDTDFVSGDDVLTCCNQRALSAGVVVTLKESISQNRTHDDIDVPKNASIL